MKKNNFKKGQSIWEVVVALGIISLVALGLVKVSTLSIKSARFSADQSKITALAQKKFAEVVDFKNKNSKFWTDQVFFNHFNRDEYDQIEGYCLKTTVSDKSSDPNLLPTTTPNYSQAKIAQITVVVFWDEKAEVTGFGQCDGKDFEHSTSFDTYVTN